ncbi:hypothetical protein Chor_009886 [Crotalus horridus]
MMMMINGPCWGSERNMRNLRIKHDFSELKEDAATLGFAVGNVVGMYLAQNYDVPNIAKKIEDIKRDVEAKKKPPSDK